MNKLALFLCCIICFSKAGLSQNEQTDDLIREKLAELETESFQENNSQEDYQLFEAIELYTHSPLNINTCTENELIQFPFFNHQIAKQLIEHRLRFGKLISIEELQLIDGIEPDKIKSMKTLLTLGSSASQRKITIKSLLQDGENSILIRYQPNNYVEEKNSEERGSPHKIYFRYKYQFADRVRFGITGEKDGGEKFFKGTNKTGFDFYSGNLIFKSKTFLKQITLGDYTVQSGQGLVLWSGMGFGKSSEVLNIQKQGSGVKPYTSVDENNFMRGIAISTSIKSWTTDIFFSSHKKDGNFVSGDPENAFTAFQTSGYHRTAAEIEDRKNILETNMGGSVKKPIGNFSFGAVAYYTKLSNPLLKEISLNNLYDFRGKTNINYGINISYLYKNIHSFSEIARSQNGGTALLIGSVIHLHPKISYAFIIRNYEKNYQAALAKGFSENTKTTNEQGIFSSIQIKIPFNLTLSAYADYFVFPWSKFGVDGPSSGNEYLMQIKWRPKRSIESYLQMKSKIKEENTRPEGSSFNRILSNRRTNVRWHIRIKLNETWDWGNRIEKSFYEKANGESSSGIMIYQDILYHPLNFPLSVGIRYALFDTDNYDTRIYAYENDVLFSYSIPAMQGRGERMYINLRYRINKMIDLWLRYSITNYNKDVSLTEDANAMKDPKKDIKVQMRLRF
ncbi:MAG TPA: helix-hairpin-helix domain-containing protein [Bacteroidia bacterium]|nr:helix-hairpin-helix domain-containing protein [Bacteroidia bacterium]HNS12320.1 helix-hairpin-helix domain-containing protein [Bacteroidia bacterium]